MALSGVFGGTFDPIHLGHLATVREVRRTLALDAVRFIPAATPPHRDSPHASAADRLAMVELAVVEYPGFTVDDRELKRAAPSFTYDTLCSLRAEFPGRILCLIMGRDALLGLPTWHRWEEILQLAHIAVMDRPGWRGGAPRPEWWRRAGTADRDDLLRSPGGKIISVAVTPVDISATDIREGIREGRDMSALLPPAVWDYISRKRLYDRHH